MGDIASFIQRRATPVLLVVLRISPPYPHREGLKSLIFGFIYVVRALRQRAYIRLQICFAKRSHIAYKPLQLRLTVATFLVVRFAARHSGRPIGVNASKAREYIK